jgi:preprotein translocase subunit SecF
MFSFTKNRFTFYIIAVVLFVFSLLTPFLFRLNFGIDMTGGVQIEYNVARGNIDTIVEKTRTEVIEKTKNSLDASTKDIITDTLVYKVSGSEHFIVEAGIHEE